MRSTLLALAAAGMASAQVYNTSTCTIPTITLAKGPIATITQTYTSTYCPACPSVVTTYQTVYSSFCPTGLAPATYTITQTCAPAGCPTGLPPGFVTSVGVCNVCGPTPITATLTQPCTSCSYATQTQSYQTIYPTFGPSGTTPATYMVTASCAATPCPQPAPGSPAPGFGTSVAVCSTCGPTPITATLTVPTTVNAVGGGPTNNPVAPVVPYTGAASSNHVAAYLAAGVALLAAVARI